MKYLCGKCIHFDVCYVPRSIGCVEICGHFKEEPKEPMTEQEFIQTCDTEQLAEVLFSWYKLGRLDAINKHTEVKKDWLIEHLEQPHTVKE